MAVQTIFVAHGALGAAAQMEPIAEALCVLGDGRCAVRTIEFPGHGDTPLGDDHAFSIDAFVEMLSDVVRPVDVPPVLFGYSMGGYVGLSLESRSPGSFAAIVTLGTKFGDARKRGS